MADATLRDEDDTVTNTLTAYATGGQANATQLNKFINVITVCATAGDSVKLPSAEAGAECTVINKGATSADCFPNTDDVIGTKAANEAVPVSPNGTLFLKAYDSINWVVL